MIDLLICSLPSGIINRPPAAPAILKACAEQQGFTAVTVDLSLQFYKNQCNKNFDTYTQYSSLFEPLVPFDRTGVAYAAVEQWITHSVQFIKQHDPKFVGLSVFSTFQHRAAVLLSQAIRKHFPQTKIILGGYGLPVSVSESFNGFLPKDQLVGNFNTYMLTENLSDYQIHGEGEDAIVSVLMGNQVSDRPVDLMAVPAPNFDNYELGEYMWHTEPVLTITGSKGCVRACTFCNVPDKFGRYRRRTGSHIAAEMIELNRKYGVSKFEFTDSLVNGSQKDFYEFVEVLADHNDNAAADKKITWYGQYICRPQAQIPNEIYGLIKRSGALNLIIGAESGSNAVLEAMNKKMCVEDLFDELEQFKKHGLQAQLLIMSGFYNETWPRYLETLEMLVKCHTYTASGVISRISVGPTLIIARGDAGGYLYHHADELGIVLNDQNVLDWRTVEDPTNTWLERVKRKVISQLVLGKMQIPITGNSILEFKKMIEQLKVYEQQLRSSNPHTDTRLTELQAH